MDTLKKNFFFVVVTILVGFAVVAGAAQATDISTKIVLDPTFDGSSSAQSVEADATLDDFSGGYGAGAMGNVMGTVASGADSIVAGLIGKYNVDTNDSDHPAAGVVGEVGEDSDGTADAAFLAVLGGDSGAVTAGSAYGVRYMNSTPGAEFDYGLDLSGDAFGGFNAVTYNVADVRLSTGVTISSGSGAPTADCDQGSMYLRTDGAADSTIYACTAADTWTAMSNE